MEIMKIKININLNIQDWIKILQMQFKLIILRKMEKQNQEVN
jgi:hypothetical protein